MQEIPFDPPFLFEYGNQQKEWSYSYVIFPALFGRKAAVLNSLKHIIMSNTIANQNGYSVNHTHDMKCVITQKTSDGQPEKIVFETPVNKSVNLYLFNIMEIFKVLPDAPPLHMGIIAGPMIQRKKTRITSAVYNEVMQLHKRMGHATPEVMANAILNGAWINTQLTPHIIQESFKYGDCLQCKLAKTKRLLISVGLGIPPPYDGYEISTDYISVSITGKGGFTGFFLFREKLVGITIPYLVKSKSTFLEACLSVRAYFKSCISLKMYEF